MNLRTAILLITIIPALAIATPAAAKPPLQTTTSAQDTCEQGATDCLVGCAGIDTTTKVGQTIYNRCVPKCNRTRNSCLLFSTRK